MIKKVIAALVICMGIAFAIPVTAQAQNVQEYIVKKGDTLWHIARTYLGNGRRYVEIFEKNRDIIKDPNLIYPGMHLVIECDLDEIDFDDNDVVEPFYDEYIYEVRGDEYQRAEVYVGSDYKIEVNEKFGKDYIIMTEPEAAEVKDGTIIAKSIGIGVVFPVDKKGNVEPGWSLVILEPGSYGVFTNDDQWVYDSGDKKIKAVKSSDESIATVSFEENKVYAHGQQKKGTCKFKIVFEDGTSHVLGISVIGDYSEVYDELMGEANKQIKNR